MYTSKIHLLLSIALHEGFFGSVPYLGISHICGRLPSFQLRLHTSPCEWAFYLLCQYIFVFSCLRAFWDSWRMKSFSMWSLTEVLALLFLCPHLDFIAVLSWYCYISVTVRQTVSCYWLRYWYMTFACWSLMSFY